MASVQAPPEQARPRSILTTIGLVALVVAAVIGADPFHVRERLVERIAPGAETQPVAEVGWKGVVTLRGVGSTKAAPFSIDRTATRWRVKWSCQSPGNLTVREAGQPQPVIDAICPASGVGFANQTGTQYLDVSTNGPWQLEVEEPAPGGPAGAPM